MRVFSCFREIQESLKNEICEMQMKFGGYKPGLAIVQVGDRPDSNVYIRQKIKSAAEIGISCQHCRLPRSSTQFDVCILYIYYMYSICKFATIVIFMDSSIKEAITAFFF